MTHEDRMLIAAALEYYANAMENPKFILRQFTPEGCDKNAKRARELAVEIKPRGLAEPQPQER